MRELDGRGWRVSGFVVFMLGGGLVLETGAVPFGAALMVLGASCFVWGLVPGRGRRGKAS